LEDVRHARLSTFSDRLRSANALAMRRLLQCLLRCNISLEIIKTVQHARNGHANERLVKAIFYKTGVTRQPELVKVVMASPLWIAGGLLPWNAPI
jgi:hypothetical protein